MRKTSGEGVRMASDFRWNVCVCVRLAPLRDSNGINYGHEGCERKRDFLEADQTCLYSVIYSRENMLSVLS